MKITIFTILRLSFLYKQLHRESWNFCYWDISHILRSPTTHTNWLLFTLVYILWRYIPRDNLVNTVIVRPDSLQLQSLIFYWFPRLVSHHRSHILQYVCLEAKMAARSRNSRRLIDCSATQLLIFPRVMELAFHRSFHSLNDYVRWNWFCMF